MPESFDGELPDVRLADVVTFLKVRTYGSVSGAARQLSVTPSQVSKAVARLEHNLQVELLARGARGVMVTDAGNRLVPNLEELVEKVRRLKPREDLSRAEITIAAPSSLSAPLLPSLLRALPDIRVRGLELPSALVRALAGESLFQFAVIGDPQRLPSNWEAEPLGALRSGLFASPSRRASLGGSPVAVDVVRTLPFVSPVHVTNGHFVRANDDGCPLVRDERILGHEAQSMAMALEFAASSDQVTFGPVLAARRHLQNGDLVEIEVEGWAVSSPLFLVFDSHNASARVQRLILAALREALAGQP